MRTVFVDKRRIQLRLCFYVKQGEINSYKISEVTQIEFQGSERRHRRHKSSLAVCQCGSVTVEAIYLRLIIKPVPNQALAIGGQEAEVNEFPWAALLLLRSSETNRTSRCGGSLISDRHVLTAAHCLKDFTKRGRVNDVWDDTTVVLGEIEIMN